MSASAGQGPDAPRLRPASARGRVAGADGIAAVEAFSRADAIDPAWMGWGALRVLSTQCWAPGAVRDEGRVANMERLLLVLSGALDADCGEPGRQRVGAGAALWIGAGHGIAARLANASSTRPLRLVEAWLQPDRVNAPPRIGLRAGPPAPGAGQSGGTGSGWTLLAAGTNPAAPASASVAARAETGDPVAAGAPGSAAILAPAAGDPLPLRLQAQLMSAWLAPGSSLALPRSTAGRAWLEVIDGDVVARLPSAEPGASPRLGAGDGLAWLAGGRAPAAVAASGDGLARVLLLALPA